METLITIFVTVFAGLLLIALGRGLLGAIELVVSSRRSPPRPARLQTLQVFGWFLLLLGVLPVLVLLATAAGQLWFAEARAIDADAWVAALVSLMPGMLVSLAGLMLILVTSDVESESDNAPSGNLRALSRFGWIAIAVGLLLVLGLAASMIFEQPLHGRQWAHGSAFWPAFSSFCLLTGLLIVGGLFLIGCVKWLGGRRLSGAEFYLDWRLDVLTILGWFYTILGLLFLAWMMAIPIAIALAIIVSRRQQASRDSLLWSLALVAHRQMPLGPTVAAFADCCRGKYRRRVLALSEYLESGLSLPDARDRQPKVLSEAGEVAARVGWENGLLAPALRDAAVTRTYQPTPWQAVQGRLLYLIAVLTLIFWITGFVLYFIIPKFKKIFLDFGVELPQISTLVLEVSDIVVEYWYVVIPLLFASLIYLLVLSFGGRSWAPWFLWRLLIRIDTAQILRALAVTMDGGLPLTAGLRALARTYPRVGIRSQLQRVHDAVSGGADWCTSLGTAGLVSTIDGAVLESAQRVGNLPWAMREMAESGERRLSYRLQALVQIVFPITVLCIGALVFFILTGLFMPLVKLITELSG